MCKPDTNARTQIGSLFGEGISPRSITRITGVAKYTVSKLLVDVGRVCAEYQDRVLRDLSSKRVHVDGIWSFIYAKPKNVINVKKQSAWRQLFPPVASSEERIGASVARVCSTLVLDCSRR
jgi:hypothetical protein